MLKSSLSVSVSLFLSLSPFFCLSLSLCLMGEVMLGQINGQIDEMIVGGEVKA